MNKEHNTLLGWLILLVCLVLGNSISGYLKLSIPGSLLGMMLLLVGCFVMKEPLRDKVRLVSNSIIPYLSLSILPVCAQIIDHWILLQAEGLRILAVLLLSLMIGMAATGWSFQWISRNRDQRLAKGQRLSRQDD